MWYGHGANPVLMIRTEWDGSDSDVYLAIKGGSAANNHSHMDAGSFVFESKGVRWACDLGNQKYAPLEIAMKKMLKLHLMQSSVQMLLIYQIHKFS